MLIARESFSVRFEGYDHTFKGDVTRVDENHPILTQSNSGDIRHLFKPCTAHYRSEQPVLPPTETRRGPGRPRKHPVA